VVDFTMPVTSARGIPPAQFVITFTGACTSMSALARARYKIMHPSIFFLDDGHPTSEVLQTGIQLTPAGVPVHRGVIVRAVPGLQVVAYFIDVRLEELDGMGNVVSTKTHIMTVQ
jgi:hypothetical protein